MRHVAIDEVDPSGSMGGQELRQLTEALGAANVALDRYVVEPGGAFTGSLHAAAGQEEVVLVTEGTATFEARPEPTADSETVAVEAGEAVRFAPGEYKQGRNESDAPVVALSIAAPQDPGEHRVPQGCPACGESDYLVAERGEAGFELVCPACGERMTP